MKNSIPLKSQSLVLLSILMLQGPAHAGVMSDLFSATKEALFSSQAVKNVVSSVTSPKVDNTLIQNGLEEKFLYSVTEDIKVSKAKELAFLDLVVSQTLNLSVLNYNGLRSSSWTVGEYVETLGDGRLTEIVPDYSDKGLRFRFRFTKAALDNPKVMLKDLASLYAMTRAKDNLSFNDFLNGKVSPTVISEIESPHAIAEMIMNARKGSPTAQARWASLQLKLIENMTVNGKIADRVGITQQHLEETKSDLEKSLADLKVKAIAHERKQSRIFEKWKSETKTLDKFEAMEAKLDDLILRNDRKGVRNLLENYLPWATMEPVEANAWKIWLEAIENPNWKDSTVAFRGLKYDTDKIQRRQTANGEVYGFMSTVLTKNQGNYSRRLRSLTTNREKNGDIGFINHGSEFHSIKITDQMTAHARNPVASSFISFTYSPDVAKRFMGGDITKEIKGESVKVPYGGMLVVRMDSRRLIPNVSSMYSGEIELLAPLIVFPDEVVKYKEGSFNDKYTFEQMIVEVSEKTGIDFRKAAQAIDTNNEVLSQRYKREGFEFLRDINGLSQAILTCNKMFSL